MKLNKPEFEGVLYGISDVSFRKISRLFGNAFEQCEFVFIEDRPGAMILSGTKNLLLSIEDRTALFDLVCDLLSKDARGLILSREWREDGSVKLVQYIFGGGGWKVEALETA